ncbi:MAG: hypothetical protein JW755_03050 [Candidatus Aminicenantes bacterium]|nr:hypothetical protein [Candidatus Aminicenantes bacterium]
MVEKEKQEAIENIELIRALILRTKRDMSLHGGGWISIIWGLFSFVGVAGPRLFIPQGYWIGIWWMALAVIGVMATVMVSRSSMHSQPQKERKDYMRCFLLFWLPLMILAYTLSFLIVLHTAISNDYIACVTLMVISTGYLIIGFLFFRGLLYMGVIGYISSVLTAVFLPEYGDIILGAIFGVGLIITGIVMNKKWKNI